MQDDARKLLYDIQAAAESIESFSLGRTLEDYESDEYFRSAVERKFEIIGEACTRLRDCDEETFYKIEKAPEIIGFRNRLIHGYDSVDNPTVWFILKDYLPLLKEQVVSLMKSE